MHWLAASLHLVENLLHLFSHRLQFHCSNLPHYFQIDPKIVMNQLSVRSDIYNTLLNVSYNPRYPNASHSRGGQQIYFSPQ